MIENLSDIELIGTTVVVTSPDKLPEKCVAASIGMFDGVHCGHKWLISHLRLLAARCGMKSAVITFRDHPQNILHPDSKLKMLMPLEARLKKLASTGIDFIILMDFTSELSKLDSTEYIRLVSRHYGVGALLMGFNHRFGHNRSECHDDYVRNGAMLGVKIERADEYHGEAAPVSSSIIRRLIDDGDVETAALKLGSPFRLSGKVVHGFARGREIGFPTANIDASNGVIVPRHSVYAVIVHSCSTSYGGMVNIGVRPTFADGDKLSIEVNIFDFDGDIYDEYIDMDFVARLRNERPMKSIDDLKSQLEDDRDTAKKILAQQLKS